MFKACPTSPKCLKTPTPFQTKTIHTMKKWLFLAHTLKYYSLANYYAWRYCLKLLLLTRAEGISPPYFASVLLTKACFYKEQSKQNKTKPQNKTKRLEQFNEHSFFYLPALLTHFLQSATTEFKVFTSIIKKKQVSALMRRHSKQIIGRGRSQRSGVKLTTKFNVTDHMTSSYLF